MPRRGSRVRSPSRAFFICLLFYIRSDPLKIFKTIILCILISVIAYCSYNLIVYYINSENNRQSYQDVRNIAFGSTPYPENNAENNLSESRNNDKKDGKFNYNALLDANPDCIGWIRINGTNIDYPVVQCTDNEYYLHHDFKKRNTICGTIFADSRCDINEENGHIILYGHQMKDGSMFKQLNKYKDKDFYTNHKNIILYKGETKHTYEIVAVYIISVKENSDYYNYTDAETRSGFLSYLGTMSSLKLYETGNPINENDSLISLSTCEYSNADGRLIVLAKNIS